MQYRVLFLIQISKTVILRISSTYTFPNIKLVHRDKFCRDLETSLTPLLQDLMYLPITQESLNNSFNQLVETLSNVIENNAPLQTTSRRQKRILQKPCLTKVFLISIKNKQKMYSIKASF